MTSIRGCRMHLLQSFIEEIFLVSRFCIFFVTDGYTLNHSCLSTPKFIFLMAATMTLLWIVCGKKMDYVCSLLLTLSFTHKIQSRRGAFSVEKEAQGTGSTHNSVFSKVTCCRHHSSLLLSYIMASSFAKNGFTSCFFHSVRNTQWILSWEP